MNNLVICIMLLCTLSMVAICFHISNNDALDKECAKYFILSAILIGVATVIEGSCYIPGLMEANIALYKVLVGVELSLNVFVVMMQCYALDMKKQAVFARNFGIIYSIAILFTMPFGLVFSLDGVNGYKWGPLLPLVVTVFVLSSAYMIRVLHLLGKKLGASDTRTLMMTSVILLTGLVASLVVRNDAISFFTVSLGFVMVYLYYSGFRQRRLAAQVSERNEIIARVSYQSMEAMMSAVDARDRYTRGHSYRVAEYCAKLAESMGYSDDEVRAVRYAALMHDVGKIGIPDSVLNKGSRLNNVEYDMMKSHTILGGEITSKISGFPGAYDASRSHHERYDGKGYPDGLSGADIPALARMVAIADTYDAMNSDRIYRNALPDDVIREEMIKGSGHQFDPEMLDKFIALHDEGALYEIGQSGRRDERLEVEDSFLELTKDLFELFLVKYEFYGEWDEEFTEWERLEKIIEGYAKINDAKATLAVVSLTGRDGENLSDESMQENISLMHKAVSDSCDDGDLCARISRKQMAVLLRDKDEYESENRIREMLLYFYKIADAKDLDIDYRII